MGIPPKFDRWLDQLELRVQTNVTEWLQNLSDAELAVVAGHGDPNVSVYMDSLPDAELHALAQGELEALRRFPVAYQRWRQRQAGS